MVSICTFLTFCFPSFCHCVGTIFKFIRNALSMKICSLEQVVEVTEMKRED